MKNVLGDQFETEISAEIVSKVRPRWPKLLTILVWAQHRPSQMLSIKKRESQVHAARRYDRSRPPSRSLDSILAFIDSGCSKGTISSLSKP